MLTYRSLYHPTAGKRLLPMTPRYYSPRPGTFTICSVKLVPPLSLWSAVTLYSCVKSPHNGNFGP